MTYPNTGGAKTICGGCGKAVTSIRRHLQRGRCRAQGHPLRKFKSLREMSSMDATLARMLRHLVARAKELNVAGMARDAIMTEVITDGANLINSALVATFLQGKEREISGAGVKTPPTMRDSDRAEIKRMSDKYLADFKKIVEDALAGVE